MPDPATLESLRLSVLSAVALKELQPDWSDAVIDEWLNFLDSIIEIANLLDIEIDQKIEEIPTDFEDGSIPFAEGGKLVEANDNLFWDITNFVLKITGQIQSTGRLKGEVVVTAAQSPYTILKTDETIIADTDTGAISLLLPSGVNNTAYRVVNSGVSGNNVTLTPNGTQLLYGVNASEFLIDLEHLDLQYSSKGWN